MNLAKRIIAVVGAPALLAGFMLAGSASVKPAIGAAKLPDTIVFTGTIIAGNTTGTIISNTCTLTGSGEASRPCFLSGAGTLDVEDPGLVSVTITGNFAPISLQFLGNGCNLGSGIQAGTKVVAVTARENLKTPQPTANPNVFTVKGTITVRAGGSSTCSD